MYTRKHGRLMWSVGLGAFHPDNRVLVAVGSRCTATPNTAMPPHLKKHTESLVVSYDVRVFDTSVADQQQYPSAACPHHSRSPPICIPCRLSGLTSTSDILCDRYSNNDSSTTDVTL